jgi:Tfp pilus assembly protein PilX
MTRISASSQRQHGATLLFALLTLVALMLSTLALVRSTDIGALLMGNLGFKQDATASSEQATRQALDWLSTELAALNADKPVNGYYASTKEKGATPADFSGRRHGHATDHCTNTRQARSTGMPTTAKRCRQMEVTQSEVA